MVVTQYIPSRCTSHGRICNVIIDNGSYKNVVAQDMVTKLNLKTKKKLKPYKFS